jgi:hypothetical protein
MPNRFRASARADFRSQTSTGETAQFKALIDADVSALGIEFVMSESGEKRDAQNNITSKFDDTFWADGEASHLKCTDLVGKVTYELKSNTLDWNPQLGKKKCWPIGPLSSMRRVNGVIRKSEQTSGPVWDRINNYLVLLVGKLEQDWRQQLKGKKLHKQDLKVLTSLKKHWPVLTLFLSDPQIPLHNNKAERLQGYSKGPHSLLKGIKVPKLAESDMS